MEKSSLDEIQFVLSLQELVRPARQVIDSVLPSIIRWLAHVVVVIVYIMLLPLIS